MIPRRSFVLGSTALLGVVAAGCSHPKGITQGGNVRLAMVTDTGGLGDQSFNDGAYRGLLDAKKDLHAEIAVLQSRSAADYQPNLTVLANKEYDEIFAIGFLMARDVDEVASRFPTRNFAIIDAVVDEPNVASITFREQEGSFLAGVAAAMATKTKTIAFLGGIDIPLLTQIRGRLHRRRASDRPEHQRAGEVRRLVRRRRRGQRARRRAALDRMPTSSTSRPAKPGSARSNKSRIMPARTRSASTSNQDALVPGKILTSMVKRVDIGVLTISRIAATGKVPHGHIELGLKDGAIGLTDFKYTRNALTPAQFHELDVLRSAIIAGKIVPPTTREQLATWKPVKL